MSPTAPLPPTSPRSLIRDALGAAHSVLLVGDYGSGKSEVAVNLALLFAAPPALGGDPERVAIADLDLINPYFRCREAHAPLAAAGIRVVVPGGGQQFADLPILLPQVKGLLQDPDTLAVLDVGGDEVGARVLSALAGCAPPATTALWFVINASRPFNDTVDGCRRTIIRVESASGLRVTGLVANTHLLQETTPELVRQGLDLALAVGQAHGVPVVCLAAMERIADTLAASELPCPLLRLRRLLVPPWLRPELPLDIPRLGPALLRPSST